MKCFNHPERDAVTTCSGCNKGLCQDCTISVSQGSYCPNCFEDLIKYQKGLLFSLTWRIAFFVVFFVFGVGGAVYGYCTVENYRDAIPNIAVCSVIGSVPLSFYYMKGTPNPYVPTSFKSAGILMIFNLVIRCILGPIFVLKAAYDYSVVRKAKKNNEFVLESVKTNM